MDLPVFRLNTKTTGSVRSPAGLSNAAIDYA